MLTCIDMPHDIIAFKKSTTCCAQLSNRKGLIYSSTFNIIQHCITNHDNILISGRDGHFQHKSSLLLVTPLIGRPLGNDEGPTGVWASVGWSGAHQMSNTGPAQTGRTETQPSVCSLQWGQIMDLSMDNPLCYCKINPIISTCNHVSNDLYRHGINMAIVVHMTWKGRFKLLFPLLSSLCCNLHWPRTQR